MGDIPGDVSTTATIAVGDNTSSAIDTTGDHDWYAVTLTAGQSITITATGGGSLDTYLKVYDPSGTTVLASNDDIVAGQNTNSRVTFTAPTAGTYYIDVGAYHDQSTGTYDLFVEPSSQPVWTNDQIAYQLINGYRGGDVHHFNVTQGGTITVNISSLTAAEQTLARAALSEWSDIIGVHFQEVTTSAQINFSDAEDTTANGPVAQTTASWSNGIISSANIQISKSWVTDYGTSLNSYSFQTYVHEIGHALGLGHAGEYNETASYSTDALFANDSWATSVMSYFGQHESYYFSNQNFSEDYAVTPMAADILAMQQLYGLSTTTRTGDTTYGFNSNAGGIYDAGLYPNVAYTIYDSGGTDTIDGSGSTSSQRINLNPETFSNFNGSIGNLTIARGVVIENATGGSGDDTIIGNSANNVLDGGTGNDTVSYEAATAGVTVNLGLSTPQDTGSAGIDQLSGFENLIGSAFSDTLIGGPSTATINGGAGDDLIEAGTANPATVITMNGGDGNDTFVVGSGPFHIDGGAGFNTVDGSNAPAGLVLTTYGYVNGAPDTTWNIQEMIGSNYADNLTVSSPGDILLGGAGDDTLTSTGGGAQLAGGTGNDTYYSSNSTDQIIENPGEGTDTVVPRGNYTLGANLENLTLYEYLPWDPYAGASIQPAPNEDWSATGNDVANVIKGNLGNNVLTGLGGADTLTGGGGNDTFKDTAAGLNGDTITDFGVGDRIVISDASLSGFWISKSGTTLSFPGGSITLSADPGGVITFNAAPDGGVQLNVVQHHPANDFNGDGISDVLWRSDSGSMQEWLGKANGSFAYNASASYAMPTSQHIAAIADVNGDGRADILWRGDDGAVREWLGQANGSFAYNSALAYQMPTTQHLVTSGDFNGDGRADILWRGDDGAITEWLGQATGSFAFNSAAGAQLATSWQVAVSGDFNGDGRADVLWTDSSGHTQTWLAQANGGFAVSAAAYQMPNGWQAVGSGDFNGDGRNDVLWRNDSTGGTIEWLGNGSGAFSFNSAANSNLAPGWHVAQIGDFNGDGRDDILWRNDSGAATAWIGEPDGSFAFSNASYAMPTSWHVESATNLL